MSQQQNPLSRFITPLLVACVVFLGFQMFFQPGKKDQPVIADVKKSYETAVKDNDSGKIIELGRTYASQLEETDKAAANEVRLKIAEATRLQAEKTGDFNLAVASYNEIHNVYKSDPSESVKQRAFDEMAKTAEVGKKAASTSIGYRFVDMVVGWLGGVNKPGFSYWFAGVLLAVLVRIAVWPLMTKQSMGFTRMARL